MKFSAALPDMVSGPSGASKASVADQLRGVDTSVLDRLVAVHQEEARLEEYRSRAQQMKGKVTEAVYRRVLDDYLKRGAALEQQAAPLRTKARAEYRKLRALVDHISRAYEQAKLEKEEVEFRHAVGELDDERCAERLQAPQRVLDECQADMACIDEYKARFIDALGSEAALDAPGPAEPPEPPQAAATVLVEPPRPAKERPEPAAPRGPVPSAAPPPRPASPDATMIVSETRVIPPADETKLVTPDDSATPPPPAVPADESEGRTMLVPLAGLIRESDKLPRAEYRLGAINYLGRAEDNQVQITSPGVSRKHAVIAAAARGFQVKDLGSQNGVFVNGERVTERTLADGDRIEIAGVAFVFRSPWPPPQASKPAGGAAGKSGAAR
jgi:hypothetical protein